MLLVSRERRGLSYILVITLIERVCASPKIGKGLNNSIDNKGKAVELLEARKGTIRASAKRLQAARTGV